MIVDEALGRTDCGGICLTGFSLDFGDTFGSGNICSIYPLLLVFETCEGNGPFLSSGSDCGGTGDESMSPTVDAAGTYTLTVSCDTCQNQDTVVITKTVFATGDVNGDSNIDAAILSRLSTYCSAPTSIRRMSARRTWTEAAAPRSKISMDSCRRCCHPRSRHIRSIAEGATRPPTVPVDGRVVMQRDEPSE